MIYDIKVNSMKNPLGIDDKNPRFSWKMKSDKRGTMQSAYQIIVSSDENFGQIIWDCGKIKSDKSIGIVYKGSPLKPKTRYYLKINLWDEENNLSSDDTAWFETGLMGTDSSVWNGAKWIGCPKKTTNASALDTYLLSADFKVEVSNKAGFVVAARNKDNYVLFEIDMDKRLLASYEYCDNAWDGSYESGNVPTVKALGNSKGYVIPENAVAYGREYAEHNFTLKVDGRAVTVLINGIKIIDNEKDFMPENKPNQPRKSYLMHIGFKQENSRAVYDNLTIANTFTGDIYQQDDFSDDAGAMSILGDVTDGKLIVENRFELACPVPSVNVKKDFSVEKKIRSARLYASARGFYNAYINGKKVGENFFDPGFTDYRLRIQYQTFDVTDMLCQGQNVIGATVGKGYYCGYVGYSGALIYGKQTSFIAQLTITYEDGATDTIVTDKSWKFTDKGPVADSDYLDGETYDARLDFDDWKKDFPSNCGEMPWPDAPKPTNREFEEKVPFELSAQIGPAAKVERTIAPICISENPKGHYIYDFGQNMVGTIRLAVKGERGASIKIRYGEMIYKNGEIYIKNLRTAANTDVYTLKGDPNGETFIPSYTSHGFRYVEITGNGFVLENPDIIVNIEGLVLCNIESVTGDFKCSNELVNKLQKNIKWGQRGNYLLVPTDCPQRNERMGWTGDAQVFAGTAAYNMDVAAFTEKWLQDLKDAQLMYNMDGAVPDTAPLGGDNRSDGCAGWADAAVIVPWEMYMAYGDVSILEKNYDMMTKWIAYQSLDSRQNYGIRKVDGVQVPNESNFSEMPYIQVQQRRGDHLAYDESTPFILSATAYAARVAQLMAKTAEILGKTDDAAMYRNRFDNIKKAFNDAWVKDNGSIAYWGEMSKSSKDINGNIINKTYYSNDADNPNHPSQTAYALAIDFGLISKEKLERAGECLKQSILDMDGHLSVGFLGISHLAPALTKAGLISAAFDLLEKESNPSWLYSVINGATTIWERWDSYVAETDTFGDVAMNSFNHYSYGAIGEWMYKNILGIAPDDENPGYKHIILKPAFGGSLTYAKGWHESPYGKIEAEWELNSGNFLYSCTIPPNTTASLYLPTDNPMKVEFDANDAQWAAFARINNGKIVYELVSGKYTFKVKLG